MSTLVKTCRYDASACPFQGTGASADRLQWRHCIRCGREVPRSQQDAALGASSHEEPSLFPAYAIVKSGLVSDHPITLAGRHVVATGADGIETFSVDRLGDHDPSHHDAFREHHVDTTVAEGAVFAPFFDAPFLYWISGQRLIRLRMGASQRQASPEVLAEDLGGTLSAAPAAVRIPAAASEVHPLNGAPSQTHVAFPLQQRLAILAMNRHHHPVTDDDELLHDVGVETDEAWHTPVFDAETSTWIAVDEGGTAVHVKGQWVSDSSPPISEIDRQPYRLVSADDVYVGQPCIVGRCLFAVYWGSGGQSGIVRLNLDDGNCTPFAPWHVSLSRDGGRHMPPLPYRNEGVLHPGEDHRQVLFVPSDGSGERALRLDGIDRFYHKYTVGVGDHVVAWAPANDAGMTSHLLDVEVDLQSRHLRGSVRHTFQNVPWDAVQALRYLPPVPGHPARLLGQTRDALHYLYPQRAS